MGSLTLAADTKMWIRGTLYTTLLALQVSILAVGADLDNHVPIETTGIGGHHLYPDGYKNANDFRRFGHLHEFRARQDPGLLLTFDGLGVSTLAGLTIDAATLY